MDGELSKREVAEYFWVKSGRTWKRTRARKQFFDSLRSPSTLDFLGLFAVGLAEGRGQFSNYHLGGRLDASDEFLLSVIFCLEP